MIKIKQHQHSTGKWSFSIEQDGVNRAHSDDTYTDPAQMEEVIEDITRSIAKHNGHKEDVEKFILTERQK